LKKLVIAIDGPAASGKSTTARLIAERLGYLFVDTGAMYRAMTFKVLEQQLPLDDVEAIARLAERTEIQLRHQNNQLRVFLDGRDVTSEIRSPRVTRAVSAVSSIKQVREMMVREQRRMGEKGRIVLEGRDIGTEVFPDANLKVYMTAEVFERARRRQKDLQQQGIGVPVDELAREIADRDRKDSEREVSPLRQAPDAIVLDTSNMTIDEQVETIVRKVRSLTGSVS
jgi:cytidylate kinase